MEIVPRSIIEREDIYTESKRGRGEKKREKHKSGVRRRERRGFSSYKNDRDHISRKPGAKNINHTCKSKVLLTQRMFAQEAVDEDQLQYIADLCLVL